MKKVSYIVFGLVVLALASCQKEVITPRNHGCFSDVEWKMDDSRINDNSSDKTSDDFEKALGSSSSSDDSGSTNSGSTITDPNNDPDSKKKGKQ